MKVDRVIMALTANPKYTGYWPYVSKLWTEKFGITPTLVFYGTEQEQLACGIRHGEFIRLNRIESVTLSREREWACTWGLFYGATLFPDDICMLSGIDQVPLSGLFFDELKKVPNWPSKYVVGFGDAYRGSYFPSSHHVATGKMFRKIYDIDPNWQMEIEKVYATRSRYPQHVAADCWGLDETYSSEFLLKHQDVALMDIFWRLWHPRRIDRVNPTAADFDRIRHGYFSEWHGLRPFEANDQTVLAQLHEAIPVYTW
jgi:hypothetical protein